MPFTNTFNCVASATSNALFQQFGGNVSAQLAAAGLVQTPDVGQVNWATVTTPASGTNFVIGYEMWRFNDAFQSVAPVYFKLEYGQGAVFGNPSIWITVGTGSNGSGQVTGAAGVGGARLLRTVGGVLTGNLLCYASGNVARFSLMMWVRNGTSGTSNNTNRNMPLCFSLERTKDQNGNDTAQGVLLNSLSNTTWNQGYFDCKLGWVVPYENQPGCLMPAQVQTTSGINGSNTAVYPIFHSRGASFHNPGMNWLCYYNGDIPGGTTTTVPIYGANHTYMATSNAAVFISVPRAGSGLATILMRYE